MRVEGFSSSDERQLTELLARHIGVEFSVESFETDLAVLSGLDRYETITWRIVSNPAGQSGLLVEGRPKAYGPPFLMIGFNLENTTSEDFRVTLTGRYLGYDLVGSGSELRVDAHARLGSESRHGALQAARRESAVRRSICRACPAGLSTLFRTMRSSRVTGSN